MRLYILEMALNPDNGSPVPAYLIQTDDGANVLVDSGFSPELIAASKAPDFQGPRFGNLNLITDELAKIGVKPEDIHYLIATHLDPDHAGGTDLFPNAEIIVQRDNYDAAKAGHQRFAMTRSHWDKESLRYRFVDGDTELLPGIELIESSGHTPGHQAVLVRLPETGRVLLAIDAITRALGEYTPENRPTGSFDMDADATRASTRKLVDLAECEGVTLIVYGHDGNQWKTLKKAPEYYQ